MFEGIVLAGSDTTGQGLQLTMRQIGDRNVEAHMIYFRLRYIPELSGLSQTDREYALKASFARLKWRLSFVFCATLPIGFAELQLQRHLFEPSGFVSDTILFAVFGFPLMLLIYIPTAIAMVRKDLT
jgi:hypothetical protein